MLNLISLETFAADFLVIIDIQTKFFIIWRHTFFAPLTIANKLHQLDYSLI
jgi:hypothetical protein